MKRVFVTVGTTSFDYLFERVTSPEAVQVLKARGYQHLVLQVGRSSIFPDSDSCHKLTLEAFKFKDSTAEDVKCADLDISHAVVYNVRRNKKAKLPSHFAGLFMLIIYNNEMPLLVFSGEGSCLETVGAGKPLLVVFNDKLMDIHQLELARQLHQDLLYFTASNLTETLRTMDL
ncbi:UDP-N-acetylglucosamine transferase subunit ALG13 homolog isoform X2 [Oncorhynchus masou masou]|uniref:UDP-N-acetylglucosamine transferase subunit ALG13 homolog isoform X2 n=1 Tax=Oncorhynchus masou masou TaxID=90313 RepID=UPI003182E5F2